MQKYKMWCTASHGHQMMKAKADEFGYYLMFDVDTRITDLESKAVAQALRIRKLEGELRKSGHLQIFTESTHCHVNGLRYAHMCGGCMALANSGLMER
jgi:hypothetical protein